MANNRLYGYTPDPSKEVDGNRLDRLNPYEFKKGMDYELVSMGIARLAESTLEDRETATEKVIKNLQEYNGYYSALIDYETKYRNVSEGQTKPSFKSYLKEMEDYHMIEVDKSFSHDKMTEPKYKKEDHTVQFKTDKMGSFKLKALKEAIKEEILNHLQEDENIEEELAAQCTTPCPKNPDGSGGGFTGGVGCPKCGGAGNVGKSKKEKPSKNEIFKGFKKALKALKKKFKISEADFNEAVTGGGTDFCCDEKRPCCKDKLHPNYPTIHGGGKKGKSTPSKSETIKKIAETIKNLKEAKDDGFEDKEPTASQIKGIDKSIGDAKDALARAMKKVKELAPDIKKLAKETNDKIKKNPAGKTDYLKTYTTNPDVKEFIKLRKMLKSADLL